jgi:hypothetical protein
VELTIIGVIVSAISSYINWVEDQANAASRKAISEQLQKLIDLMLEVLDELKNLRVVLREELETAFRNDDIKQLIALKKSIQDALAGIADPHHIPRITAVQLEADFIEVTKLTYKLQQYGYAPYFAVVAGSLLSLQLAVVLRVPRKDLLSLFDQIRKYFSDALINDPKLQPETVRVTQEKTKVEEAGRWDDVIKFPTQGYLGSYTYLAEPGPAGEPGQWNDGSYYLRLKGTIPADKSAGFRYAEGTSDAVDEAPRLNDRNWPSYPAILHYDDDLGNDDKFKRAVANVIGFIGARLADRDDSWMRLGKLGSVLMYNGEFLNRLDEFKNKIPKS